MIHGQCGNQNPSSPGMENNVCKNFSKIMQKKLFLILLDILTTGEVIMEGKSFIIKIEWLICLGRYVVPYNPTLILKYNCDLNKKVCSTILCMKYKFKYCYKGHDCTRMSLTLIDMN